GFILLLSLIAVANVFNTISTNIFIRRREFAMLKAVGMDQKSFKRMLYFEFLFYGMKILALGIPFALLLSLALSKGLHQGLTEGLYIAGRSILISTLSVFAIILATMKIEARKIKDYNIIDAIKEENS
ncbi:MAG: ABC transporter permease, partial [Anaerovoracaceae bacterium]